MSESAAVPDLSAQLRFFCERLGQDPASLDGRIGLAAGALEREAAGGALSSATWVALQSAFPGLDWYPGAPFPGDAWRPADAPRDAVEEQVAKIWRRALGVERIGIHQTFVELGGNSVKAAQVLSRVHDVFGVRLPPEIAARAPSVAGLAVTIGRAREVERTVLLRIKPEGL